VAVQLAVFVLAVTVHGFNVFFLVEVSCLGEFFFLHSFSFHFVRLGDGDGNAGDLVRGAGVGALGWSPGCRRLGGVLDHAVGERR
jgi:hypothetical protein